jgi:hypothetical protein
VISNVKGLFCKENIQRNLQGDTWTAYCGLPGRGVVPI